VSVSEVVMSAGRGIRPTYMLRSRIDSGPFL